MCATGVGVGVCVCVVGCLCVCGGGKFGRCSEEAQQRHLTFSELIAVTPGRVFISCFCILYIYIYISIYIYRERERETF